MGARKLLLASPVRFMLLLILLAAGFMIWLPPPAGNNPSYVRLLPESIDDFRRWFWLSSPGCRHFWKIPAGALKSDVLAMAGKPDVIFHNQSAISRWANQKGCEDPSRRVSGFVLVYTICDVTYVYFDVSGKVEAVFHGGS